MNELDTYIRKAKEKQSIKSNRQLCIALNVSHNAMNDYGRGKLPSDETMIKLAKLAGIDPWIALIDLNIMRSSGEIRSQYIDIMRKIKCVAVAMFMLIALGLSATPALAEVSSSKCVSVYYGNSRNRKRRMSGAFFVAVA